MSQAINVSNNYTSGLTSTSTKFQKIIDEQLRRNGSVANIAKQVYSSKTKSSSNNSYYSGSESPTAGSNGKYMVHYYYGCQPGNRITTVIG
jgi:hypothetical protein